jgi:hypothetical protein
MMAVANVQRVDGKFTVWEPRVGDKVEIQLAPGNDFEGRLNLGIDQGSGGGFLTADVHELDGATFKARWILASGDVGEWWYRGPRHTEWDPSAPGCPRLVSTVDEQFDEDTKPEINIIHREELGKGDPRMVPASLGLKKIDHGERYIRRVLRAWPYEHDLHKRLFADDEGVIWVEWSFFPQGEDGEKRAADWCTEQYIGVVG